MSTTWTEFKSNGVSVVLASAIYTLPVADLAVRAVPVNRGGDIAVELFDGSYVQRIDGWRYEVEISWSEVDEGAFDDLFNAVVGCAREGGAVLYLDPGATDVKSISVVLSDAGNAVQALFEGQMRNRAASVKFVSKHLEASPFMWMST